MPGLIKTIKKTYPDYTKYIVYDIVWSPGLGGQKKKVKTTIDEEKMLRSVYRAKTAIHDIIACNTFEYFVTLTISPNSNIDRYDYDDCTKKISKWLNNNLNKYILVPEKHKDGAYHFHLLADIPLYKLKKFRNIYNIKSYKYGYSSAIPVRKGTEQHIAKYVQKYLTKDLFATVGKGRRMYWCSTKLERPIVEYNELVPDTAIPAYITDSFSIFVDY